MECLKDNNIAIVDVETTGTSSATSRIIEIGILRIENGECVQTYRTTINPGTRVPMWITGLTGISQEEVRTSPRFDECLDTIEALLSDAVFVAHNVAFDYGFFEREYARAGRSFHAPRLCTARLSRALFPHARRHGLSHLIERHGLFVLDRHRAWDDAYALWQFIQLCGTHPHFNTAFKNLVGEAPARLFSTEEDGEAVIR